MEKYNNMGKCIVCAVIIVLLSGCIIGLDYLRPKMQSKKLANFFY